MSRIKEAIASAKQRIHPEGVIMAGAFGLIAPYGEIPMASGIAYGLNELRNHIDPGTMRTMTLAALAVLNTISVAVESKTIRKRKYSISTSTNTLNALTGKPLRSSIGGHALGFTQLSAINPLSAIAAFTENDDLLIDSAVGTSVTIAIFRTGMNGLIHEGKAEPVERVIRTGREAVVNKVKKTIRRGDYFEGK